MLKTWTMYAVALLAVSVLAVPSHAQNLLTNPGFETGNLSGWTDGGNTGWNSVVSGQGHTGTFGISNGAVGSFSLLSQTIPTTPGTTYDVSGWIRNGRGGRINMLFNGVTVYSEAFVGHPYIQVGGSVVATGTSATFQMQFRDDPGFVQFDDASVTAQVPEPSTLPFLASGTIGLALVAVRRRFSRK